MSNGGSRNVFLWIIIGGGIFFLFLMAVFTLVLYTVRHEQNRTEIVSSGGGGTIAIVDLNGVITSPDKVVKNLKKFADDDSVKAIILHIDSPGGGVAASEEIYREVRRVRDEKKKKIVAAISDVGASGAYYVASGASKIFADHGSIVGSIGVIMEWYNYADLLKWAKTENIVIKTGEFKDTGNPARAITPAEREYLQGMADSLLVQFESNVASGRGLKVEDIKAIANGKVWTGEQAKDMKLIDDLGDFQAAIKDTAKSVGINGEPTLVKGEKEKQTLLDLITGDATDLWPSPGKLMQSNPGFYYLWK